MFFQPTCLIIPLLFTLLSPVCTKEIVTLNKRTKPGVQDDFRPISIEYLSLKNFTEVENIPYPDLKGVSFENCNLTQTLFELSKGSPNVKELTLKNNNLQILTIQRWNSLHENVVRRLEKLHIEKEKIELLVNFSFANFENLKYLSLVCIGLNKIEDNAFKGLHKLEYLDLSGNNLQNLSGEVLAPLIELKTLILKNNNIKNSDIFGRTKLLNLHTLDLENNPLEVFSKQKLKKLAPKLKVLRYCRGLSHCKSSRTAC